jgi:hypothetical protein
VLQKYSRAFEDKIELVGDIHQQEAEAENLKVKPTNYRPRRCHHTLRDLDLSITAGTFLIILFSLVGLMEYHLILTAILNYKEKIWLQLRIFLLPSGCYMLSTPNLSQ